MSKTLTTNQRSPEAAEPAARPPQPVVVIVTEKEFRKAEPAFRLATRYHLAPRPADEETLAAAVVRERARGVIIGVERYTGPLYRALKESGGGRGVIIARFGVGHDGVDKALARENGIVVCNTPGVLDISVAEHTLWLIGNLARHIPQLEARVRTGDFSAEIGHELQGKLLGIVGFGRIGRRVAALAHFGLGMRVWATGTRSAQQLAVEEKRPWAELQQTLGVERYTDNPDELFRECDVVSLHLPATPATRHFVNSARLGLMKPPAALVNTARGSLVDEIALYDALADKRIAGAALDVFEKEPYEPMAAGKDLRRLPNLVMTPHIGSNTREANQRMAEACLANLDHFFAGRFEQLTRADAVPGA